MKWEYKSLDPEGVIYTEIVWEIKVNPKPQTNKKKRQKNKMKWIKIYKLPLIKNLRS